MSLAKNYIKKRILWTNKTKGKVGYGKIKTGCKHKKRKGPAF
jgi:ribosomal protein L35AE/L33A